MSFHSEQRKDRESTSNSSESLEAKTDRYGFLLGNEEAENHSSDEPCPESVRHREMKWLTLISQWDQVLEKKMKKVKSQCQKGIPGSVRSKCWPLLCGATHRKQKNNGLYQTLESSPGQQSWIDVIKRDTDRQFPFHEMFQSKEGLGQQGLLKVLKAYTEFRPDEGYCQAQGPVAAVLLMNLPIEEAFWCLVQISEHYLPGYYSVSLEGVLFDAAILSGVLKRTCPAAYKHMKKQGVEPLMFATDWLMCLYSRHLPFNTLLRVWDLFFCYGVRVLFQVAVVLVRHCIGEPRQRKECDGQMETLERLRSVRGRVQHHQTDAFIHEVCSVPLSLADLQRQTEKEFEKWTKEHPNSTFDPRNRCHGYHMVWEKEREKENKKKEQQSGNLVVPVKRSHSSLSPAILHKKWKRRGSKGQTEELAREGHRSSQKKKKDNDDENKRQSLSDTAEELQIKTDRLPGKSEKVSQTNVICNSTAEARLSSETLDKFSPQFEKKDITSQKITHSKKCDQEDVKLSGDLNEEKYQQDICVNNTKTMQGEEREKVMTGKDNEDVPEHHDQQEDMTQEKQDKHLNDKHDNQTKIHISKQEKETDINPAQEENTQIFQEEEHEIRIIQQEHERQLNVSQQKVEMNTMSRKEDEEIEIPSCKPEEEMQHVVDKQEVEIVITSCTQDEETQLNQSQVEDESTCPLEVGEFGISGFVQEKEQDKEIDCKQVAELQNDLKIQKYTACTEKQEEILQKDNEEDDESSTKQSQDQEISNSSEQENEISTDHSQEKEGSNSNEQEKEISIDYRQEEETNNSPKQEISSNQGQGEDLNNRSEQEMEISIDQSQEVEIDNRPKQEISIDQSQDEEENNGNEQVEEISTHNSEREVEAHFNNNEEEKRLSQGSDEEEEEHVNFINVQEKEGKCFTEENEQNNEDSACLESQDDGQLQRKDEEEFNCPKTDITNYQENTDEEKAKEAIESEHDTQIDNKEEKCTLEVEQKSNDHPDVDETQNQVTVPPPTCIYLEKIGDHSATSDSTEALATQTNIQVVTSSITPEIQPAFNHNEHHSGSQETKIVVGLSKDNMQCVSEPSIPVNVCSSSNPQLCLRRSSTSNSHPTILSEDTFKDPHQIRKHKEDPQCLFTDQTQPTPKSDSETQPHTSQTVAMPAQANKPKRKGLFHLLRAEAPPKTTIPKILIQDFSEGDEKLSSKERRRRRREQERKEKEEEKERKKREKELEKEKAKERKKIQTRGRSFQVLSKKHEDILAKSGSQTLVSKRNSAPFSESYF